MTYYALCTGCFELVVDPVPCENCTPKEPQHVPLTSIAAAELSDRKWIAGSLERIADALEELCTFKEEEQREKNAAAGMKEH